ncbi:MAG: hypothetical protein GY913_30235 [Proteobacteria bacterium]|nr:hypothetical protein [Pseudomonadota bacterium]
MGTCYVEQTDITGQTRFEFLCASDFDEPFALVGQVPEGTSWYTVAGRPQTDRVAWSGGLVGLALLGMLLFGGLFSFSSPPRSAPRPAPSLGPPPS